MFVLKRNTGVSDFDDVHTWLLAGIHAWAAYVEFHRGVLRGNRANRGGAVFLQWTARYKCGETHAVNSILHIHIKDFRISDGLSVERTSMYQHMCACMHVFTNP